MSLPKITKEENANSDESLETTTDKYSSEFIATIENEKDFKADVVDAEKKPPLISKQFKREGRYCWGGLSRCAFILLILFITGLVTIAIVVPVCLYIALPSYTQHVVNKSTMDATELQINTWGVEPNSVENEHYSEYLPFFSAACKNESLASKPTFLASNVLDVMGCALEGVMSQNNTSNTAAASTQDNRSKRALDLGSLTALIPTLLNYIDFPSTMTMEQFFDTLDLGSCSAFSPNLVTSVIRVDLGGIPGIMKGSIKESYLELSNPNFHPEKSWGRIAIPNLNLNNRENGQRVMRDVEVQIQVHDRFGYLLNNLGLLNLEPLTSGKVEWLQYGNITVEIDFGATYTFPVTINKVTPIGKAEFNAGPFSVPNPELGNIKISDMYTLLGCTVMDIFAAVTPGMGENTYSLEEILHATMENFDLSSLTNTVSGGVSASSIVAADVTAQSIANAFYGNEKFENLAKSLHDCHNEHGLTVCLNEPSKIISFLSVDSSDASDMSLQSSNNFEPVFQMASGEKQPQFSLLSHSDPKGDDQYVDEQSLPKNTFDSFDICQMNSTADCSYKNMKPFNEMGDQKLGYMVYPKNVFGNDTGCLFGAPYGFTVQKPSAKTTSNRLLVYFQGGGADWNSVLNDLFDIVGILGLSSEESLATTEANPTNTGVFNMYHPLNPFQNFTIIDVLYCSGDVMMGNEKYQPNILFRTLGFKSRNRIGYNNMWATLKWIKQQPDITGNLEQLVIMGCSAGSLGAQLWGPKLMKELGMSKDNTVLIADSFVGEFPEAEVEPLHTGSYSIVSATNGDNLTSCVNTSTDSSTTMVVGNPSGMALYSSWNTCDILSKDFTIEEGLYITADDTLACENQTIIAVDVLLEAQHQSGYQFYYIQSKADNIQRLFKMLLGAVGGSFAGANTKNNAAPVIKTLSGELSPLATNSSTNAGSVQEYQWCSELNMQNGNEFKFCSQMPSCSTVESAYDTFNYYTDFSGMVTDSAALDSFLVKILQNTFGATSSGNAIRKLVSRIFTSLSVTFLGNSNADPDARGVWGESAFYSSVKSIFEQSGDNVGWFINDSEQHCYTCYDLLFVTKVDGVSLVDYIGDAINNKGATGNVCDPDGLPCPQRN